VVIFQENVSFDHYFGTYPFATNSDGSTFTPAQGTPAVNGLNFSLLAANPNESSPKRLDSSPTGLAGSPGGQLTCDQDHNYSDEQQAFDGGKMDQFVQSLGGTFGNAPGTTTPCNTLTNVVMDYYDGNTVTGLWNYAQHYAMSDNSWETTFGPSAPGAINLVSGDTGGVDTTHEANSPSISTAASPNGDITPDGHGGFSLTSDAQPYWDDCSTRDAVGLKGKNIGDLLNERHISWGWFQGGFTPTTTFADAATATGNPGQSTATFTPDEFKTSAQAWWQARMHRTRPSATRSLRSASRSAAPGSTATRTTTSRITSRSSTRLDGEPASSGADELVGHRHRHAVLRPRGASIRHRQPQLRHERLRLSRGGDHGRSALAGRPPGGQLHQGAGVRGRSRAVLRPG
jgi:hypothetical protein